MRGKARPASEAVAAEAKAVESSVGREVVATTNVAHLNRVTMFAVGVALGWG